MTTQFIQTLISLFNESKKVPYNFIFNSILEVECAKAKKMAIAEYNQKLQQRIKDKETPFDVEELFNLFGQLRSRAIDQFQISADIREAFPDYEKIIQEL